MRRSFDQFVSVEIRRRVSSVLTLCRAQSEFHSVVGHLPRWTSGECDALSDVTEFGHQRHFPLRSMSSDVVRRAADILGRILTASTCCRASERTGYDVVIFWLRHGALFDVDRCERRAIVVDVIVDDVDVGCARSDRCGRRLISLLVTCFGLARSLLDRVEYPPVEEQHDDTGDVERTHRREDQEVRVVERAECRTLDSPVGVVHSEYNRGRDGDRNHPRQYQHDVGSLGLLVLGVLDRMRYCNVPASHTHTHDDVVPACNSLATPRLRIIYWTLLPKMHQNIDNIVVDYLAAN